MLFRHEYHDGVWIDLENPTEDEVRSVSKEFPIGSRLEVELFSPTPEPLVASDNDVAFLAIHFPSRGTVDGEIRNQEVDIAVGPHFIITTRYEVIEPLHRLQKMLETQKLIDSGDIITTDIFIEILFLHLFSSVRDNMSHVVNRLSHIEHDMFNGLERTTVRRISSVSREFLHIEAGLANQEEPLDRFLKILALRKAFGPSFPERIERITAERAQIARLVKTYCAIATEMRETNAALLESRQNEIMKTLTIVNFIFLPLGLITWTFAMRTEGMPLIDSPNAFWIVISFMAIIATLLLLFFVRRRWL